MLDQRRMAAQPDEKREQLFTERYESLLAWALRLTNQQRDAAEDLVQDAFVQFMLGRTRLEEIENIDGYLRRMLRYMYVSRLSRSAQHLHETALSVADYDTFRLGWTAIEPPRRMQASEELHQICAYACLRKESSRAGSVLILRFFYDYLPTEIAAVLNSSRHCVDQWQGLARREAKLFMDDPSRLRFVNLSAPVEHGQIRYLRSDRDLMLELRQMIFDSCRGECLTRKELEEIYSNDSDAFTTPRLAHIVSCHSCLDAVNSLLGLPLLEQRYQSRPREPKEPPRGVKGGGASGGGSGDVTSKFRQRLRETHEHKPHELRIAVNGFVVSSLKVGSESSELNLNLPLDQPIEFVEVSSEQGVQLLFFTIDPDATQSEEWAWIELSEGRSLEACFQNETGPSLHVVYKEPAPAEVFNSAEPLTANTMSSPLFVVPNNVVSESQSVVSHLQTWTRKVWSRITTRQSLVTEETPAISETSLLSFLDQPGRIDHSRWRRLGWLIVLVSTVVATAFLYFKTSLPSTPTAIALLESATVAEKSEGTPDQVRHRLINLEERRSVEGAMVARRRIEIWENRTKGERVQRLYDDGNRLIAGVKQTANGNHVIYHHGSKPQSQTTPVAPDLLLLNLDDIWQLEPSALAFRALVVEPGLATIEEQSTTYILRYERERAIGASRLLKATLTLSKSDLHPIEQTLLVERGGKLSEYRFVEAGFELLSSKDVAPSAFEIEPELTGGAGERGKPGDWALRDLTSSRVPPPPSTSTPPIASAELEVDVAYLLNQAKADRNEQVALTRSAGGSLRVEGVVESQERKEEFLKALAPVSNNPAVKIEIRTIAEASQRQGPTGSITIHETEETANTVAADDQLRAYFTQKNQSGSTDEAIRSYSSRVVNHAYRALFQAIELKRLINRFAEVDMRTVAPDARAKWLGMLREHAAAFERENTALQQEIQPIFFPGMSVTVGDEALLQSDADLTRAIERLHKLALSNNDAIRSAFTISSQSSATALKSGAFWQSLLRAEKLAEKIGQYER